MTRRRRSPSSARRIFQASAPANVADYVNQLPAISGSSTPTSNQRGLTSGAAGLNTVSMRNLGSGRTLVLIDGHRTVASTMDGAVDTNLVPQGLIKSIEIVTGGASSVYGSTPSPASSTTSSTATIPASRAISATARPLMVMTTLIARR